VLCECSAPFVSSLFCVYLVVNLFIAVVTTEIQDAKTHALAKSKMQAKMAVASKLKVR
jgi:hypothetical protein